MDLLVNSPWIARKKMWWLFLKCTLQYESHSMTIRAEHSQVP